MKVLYVDNYRGFTDTYMTIKDVNFLVGENSTGKTSILAILYLLGNPRFWFGQEFNTEEVQLGTFRDIVSVKSENKTSFKVGIIDFRSDERRVPAWLVTFTEKDDLPIARRYDYYCDGREVSIVFTEKITRFRIRKLDLPGKREDSIFSMFRNWTKGEDSLKGFKEFKMKFPFPREGALVFVPGLVEGKVRPFEKEKKRALSFDMPMSIEPVAWFAPIRTKPRRTYDEFKTSFTSEGEHTPYLIRMLLSNGKSGEKFKKYLCQVGKKSDLFDSMRIRKFGDEPTSPFALNVIIGDKALNVKNVGYGVSQSLPVIVELFARSKKSWFAIQQPEIHLHPKAQAALGDVIFNLAITEKKKFLIETHTDYIIDRFRLNCRTKKRRIDSQVLFFERTARGNRVHPIEIMKNGEYSDKQPKSFRKFFMLEELKLLGIR